MLWLWERSGARQSGVPLVLCVSRVILCLWINILTYDTHSGCALFVFPSLYCLLLSHLPYVMLLVVPFSLRFPLAVVLPSSQHATPFSPPSGSISRLNSCVELSTICLAVYVMHIYSAFRLGCVVDSTFLDTLLSLKWFSSEACCHTFPVLRPPFKKNVEQNSTTLCDLM